MGKPQQINERVIAIAKEYDESHYYEVIICLFCLYHGLTTKHVKKEVKDFVTLRKLVERSNFNTINKLQFTPPFYEDYKELEKKPELSFTNFIDEWINLFPTQSKTGLTYAVSGNSRACATRMKAFIKTFNKYLGVKYMTNQKYDTIMKATEMYLKYQKNRGWAYTKKNSKFIYDNESSILQTYCQYVIAGTNCGGNDGTTLVGGLV